MLKKLLIGLILAVAVIATGCAHAKTEAESKADWEAELDKSKGKDINDVIAEVGPPSKTYQMPNGDTMYTWTRGNRRYVSKSKLGPNFYPANAKIQPSPELNTDTRGIVRSCETSFIAGKDQKITRWTYTGNSCY